MLTSCILDVIQSLKSSKKQHTVVCSSIKAEYKFVVTATIKLNRVCSLLTELHAQITHPFTIFCDNIGVTQLYSLLHRACGYWFSFIHDQIQNGVLHVAHMS